MSQLSQLNLGRLSSLHPYIAVGQQCTGSKVHAVAGVIPASLHESPPQEALQPLRIGVTWRRKSAETIRIESRYEQTYLS